MYEIYLNGELQCAHDWPPIAQAAWNRAARNRNGAQHGGQAVLVKDGAELARVKPRTIEGHPWPDSTVPEVTWNDAVSQLTLFLRDEGINARDIADAMSDAGLPTTRSRIDALRASSRNKHTAVIPAELVVMLHAVTARLAQDGDA